MTRDVQDAIKILADAQYRMACDRSIPEGDFQYWGTVIDRAIRHLAYPDRDIYPKTRRGTKGAPIVRK